MDRFRPIQYLCVFFVLLGCLSVVLTFVQIGSTSIFIFGTKFGRRPARDASPQSDASASGGALNYTALQTEWAQTEAKRYAAAQRPREMMKKAKDISENLRESNAADEDDDGDGSDADADASIPAGILPSNVTRLATSTGRAADGGGGTNEAAAELPSLVRRWIDGAPPPPPPPMPKAAMMRRMGGGAGSLAGDSLVVLGDGIVYCPIAKAACAEWRKALRWMVGVEGWESGEIHKVPANGLRLLRGLGPQKAAKILRNPEFLKFVVVREPAERLVSAFLEKCWSGKERCCTKLGRETYHSCPYLSIFPEEMAAAMAAPGASAAAAALPRQPNEATEAAFQRVKAAKSDVASFRHWVRFIAAEVKQRGCAVNAHWVPHHCRCGLDALWPIYHVIPFQNMAEEAAKLAGMLQRPTPERRRAVGDFLSQRFLVPRDTPGKVTGAKAKVDRYYTQELLDLVVEAYSRDYELFGAAFAAEPAGAADRAAARNATAVVRRR